MRWGGLAVAIALGGCGAIGAPVMPPESLLVDRSVHIPTTRVRGRFDHARLTVFRDGRFTFGSATEAPENAFAGRWDLDRGNLILRGQSLRGGHLVGMLTVRGNRAELFAQLKQPDGSDLLVEQALTRQPIGRFGRGMPGQTGIMPGGWDIWIGDGDDDEG